MCFNRRSVIFLVILVLVCVVCVESKAKKWRAHIKKKSNTPKISASYRIVTPKRKIIHKHNTAPHKRNPKMNYYHPLPSSWPKRTLPPPTYYLASNYPSYRSYLTTPSRTTTTLRKLDPFLSPNFSFGKPLRRADEFDVNSGVLPSTSLIDTSAVNADFVDGFYDPGLHMSREFVQPEISLGGWIPIDYKSFMADADFSLLNDQMALSHQLDGGGLIFQPQFV